MYSPEQTVCFTGHRDIPPEALPALRQTLLQVLSEAYVRGYRLFLSGGALGFDLLAAEAVIQFKLIHPDAELMICIPHPKQANAWDPAERLRYRRVLFQADDRNTLSQTYHKGCFHVRNRFMVEHATLCVCYFTHPAGGTAYTVAYAARQGLQLVNVAADFSVKAFIEASGPLL